MLTEDVFLLIKQYAIKFYYCTSYPNNSFLGVIALAISEPLLYIIIHSCGTFGSNVPKQTTGPNLRERSAGPTILPRMCGGEMPDQRY